MILIPASEFLIGTDRKAQERVEVMKWKRNWLDWMEREQPQHTLHLPSYYLAKMPATKAQYLAFVQATRHAPPRFWKDGKPPTGKEDHPVVYVSWADAVAYCSWLAEITGKPYRLPTEAEWEKAARGTDGRIWPWGNEWDASKCNAYNYKGSKRETTPVGSFPQGVSPYGLLDMAGNVREWTSSLFKEYPYRSDDGREDMSSSGRRVARGGSFSDHNPWISRCAYRDNWAPDLPDFSTGFRCAVAPVSPTLASEPSTL